MTRKSAGALLFQIGLVVIYVFLTAMALREGPSRGGPAFWIALAYMGLVLLSLISAKRSHKNLWQWAPIS